MLLPNAEDAVIGPEKLRDYLLNEFNTRNRGKARLFAALGYNQENWQQMAADLRVQHLSQEATELELTPFGRRFSITAALTGPEGSAIIMSVWQIDFGTEVPRFITAYQE